MIDTASFVIVVYRLWRSYFSPLFLSNGSMFGSLPHSILPHLFFHWQYCQLFREYLAEREDYLRV